MQATLDATSLKHVTKALTCLSKYGDELVLQATPERLLLHTTNSSSTAYCRFIYRNQFFTRYRVGDRNAAFDLEEIPVVDGQLSTRSLLSILKHRTVEKSVHKCELSIVDGDHPSAKSTGPGEDHDSLESRFIVRLHCKHGVIKTHKLLLSDAARHMAPNVPDTHELSRLSIGPRAIKDIIDHFPVPKSAKSDPQLIWGFNDDHVQVKSLEPSLDPRAQLITELTVDAAEFETYAIHSPPVAIAFHLREFNATITFAEACSLTLELRFTDPADPLFIEAEGGDLYDTLFVISMSQVTGATTGKKVDRETALQSRPQVKKRPLEQDDNSSVSAMPASSSSSNSRVSGVSSSTGSTGKKKLNKAVAPADSGSVAREGSSLRDTPARSMPPPSLPTSAYRAATQPLSRGQHPPGLLPARIEEPLFLPSSQISQADQELIRESGLGIENMNVEEFNAMMEDIGEEVELGDDGAHDGDVGMDEHGGQVDIPVDSLEIRDENEETQLLPTQDSAGNRTFRPLFDD